MVCWGLALAELMVPYSMKLLFLDTQTWLGMAMIGATILSAGLFTCVFLLARRHGSRFSRPQSSGYELACQDDLNQVPLHHKKTIFQSSNLFSFSGTTRRRWWFRSGRTLIRLERHECLKRKRQTTLNFVVSRLILTSLSWKISKSSEEFRVFFVSTLSPYWCHINARYFTLKLW